MRDENERLRAAIQKIATARSDGKGELTWAIDKAAALLSPCPATGE